MGGLWSKEEDHAGDVEQNLGETSLAATTIYIPTYIPSPAPTKYSDIELAVRACKFLEHILSEKHHRTEDSLGKF